jgi:hypothetical protein
MENTLTKKSQFTKVNGIIMKNMDMEKNTLIMALSIVVTIIMVLNMVRGYSYHQMGQSIKPLI